MPKLLDVGRYMVVDEDGHIDCLDTLREARERVNDLMEQGYHAYVHDLDQDLAAL